MEFFSERDQIRRKVGMWSHLLKKSLIENFIFCAVRKVTRKSHNLFRFVKFADQKISNLLL